ncbi:hypothetical protein ACHAWF_005109 [Thalassiosira exigua]
MLPIKTKMSAKARNFAYLTMLLSILSAFSLIFWSNNTTNATESEKTGHDETGGSCDDVLDTLDARFEEMRGVRKKKTATMDLGSVGQKKWWDPFEPEATCLTEERFGSRSAGRYGAFGDGPKFVCGVDHIAQKANKKEGKGCLVYSVGSNNDVSFERAVHEFMPGCETHTFDPTLRSKFVGDQYATFHDWGPGKDGDIRTMKNKTWAAKGLETIMRELGHIGRTIDILKIDCDGCEYTALPPFFDLIASGKVQISQLQVEMHSGGGIRAVHDFFAAADRAKLRIFHKERNRGCDGWRCVEYAFVSGSFLRKANAAAICPTGYLPSLESNVESKSMIQTKHHVKTEMLKEEAVMPLFDKHLIPENTAVDMNIGTNFDPLIAMEGRHRILVDPLFYVCESNAKWTSNVTAFCFAVSNQTTHFTTFLEYNKKGLSSLLSKVSAGTSHESFEVKSKRSVLVLEAKVLFLAIYNRNTTINRLKMDMQGWELSTLLNFHQLLKKPRFVSHIMAECFCQREGKQTYQIDNSCEKITEVMQDADYETKGGCGGAEWSDVIGYKRGMGLNFLDGSAWRGKRPN